MSQKHYQSQFKVVLGVGAWPGTLNVDVSRERGGFLSTSSNSVWMRGKSPNLPFRGGLRVSSGMESHSGAQLHSAEDQGI